MATARRNDFAVLGGGLAGLTFALEAVRRGRRVAVLESDAQVGGLSRTLVYGDYRFDIGGHRFHSEWPQVTAWVLDLMDGDMLSVARRSRIHLNGRYVDYPLQLPNALSAFGPGQMARVLASYLRAAASRNGHHDDISFEGWVSRRFGRALYDAYFRPYTEKVWGLKCSELSSEWASERIQLPSLLAAVKGSLLPSAKGPATLVSRFTYPRRGIGMIPDRMAQRALASGRATIHTGSQVLRLRRDDSAGGWQIRCRQDGREVELGAQHLISTIPLQALWEMLATTGETPPPLDGKLDYRGLACVFLAVDAPRISADTWTYFPDHGIGFGRIHEPRNWSPQMAPPGHSSLCVEIFCSPGDAAWQRPDGELVDGVSADLERLGLLAREKIRDAWLLRVAQAYPCYRVGYAAELQRARGYLAERYPALHLLGRTGTFRYLNMDAVIHQAVELAKALTGSA